MEIESTILSYLMGQACDFCFIQTYYYDLERLLRYYFVSIIPFNSLYSDKPCMQATCKPHARKKQSTYVYPFPNATNMRTLKKTWTEMLPGYTYIYIYKKRKKKCEKRLVLTSQFCFIDRYYESDSEYESSSSSSTIRLMTLLSNKSNANRRAGNLK